MKYFPPLLLLCGALSIQAQSDTVLVSSNTGITFVIDTDISAAQYKTGDSIPLFRVAADVKAYDRSGKQVVVFKKGAAVIDTVVSAVPFYTEKNKGRGGISHSAGFFADDKMSRICEFVIEFLAVTAVDGSQVLLSGCLLERRCTTAAGINNGDVSTLVAGTVKSCQVRWPGARVAVPGH